MKLCDRFLLNECENGSRRPEERLVTLGINWPDTTPFRLGFPRSADPLCLHPLTQPALQHGDPYRGPILGLSLHALLRRLRLCLRGHL